MGSGSGLPSAALMSDGQSECVLVPSEDWRPGAGLGAGSPIAENARLRSTRLERLGDRKIVDERCEDERTGREELDLDLLSGARRLGQVVGIRLERTGRDPIVGGRLLRRQFGGGCADQRRTSVFQQRAPIDQQPFFVSICRPPRPVRRGHRKKKAHCAKRASAQWASCVGGLEGLERRSAVALRRSDRVVHDLTVRALDFESFPRTQG
jgi:hypothetical protein